MMNDVLDQEIEEWKKENRYRALRTNTAAQGPHIIIGGREVLNCCSNDYLGLASDARLIQAATLALQQRGLGSGASRLVCGNSHEHEYLERDIAAFKKTEAALVFGAGYLANIGVIPALVGRGDIVCCDRLNHASIIDGVLLSRATLERYPHADMSALEAILSRRSARRKLIVTDTVFSMDGDVAPLREIVSLAERYNAWVMVDEAHAFGVFGPTGAGLAEEWGVGSRIEVQMGTLSKAAGVLGAYVAGSAVLREYLINRARSFIFTTAMPPAMAAAARESLALIQAEPFRRQRVLSLAATLRRGLRDLGLDVPDGMTPIIPVMAGSASRAMAWSQQLLEQGVFVSAIRPPTVPQGTSRLRVTVSAAHSDEDVGRLLEAFRTIIS